MKKYNLKEKVKSIADFLPPYYLELVCHKSEKDFNESFLEARTEKFLVYNTKLSQCTSMYKPLSSMFENKTVEDEHGS